MQIKYNKNAFRNTRHKTDKINSIRNKLQNSKINNKRGTTSEIIYKKPSDYRTVRENN